MKINELPEEVKQYALDYYLGNEIGSDQYRDAQPMSGLDAAEAFFGWTAANMTAGLTPEHIEMLRELRDWIDAIIEDSTNSTTESSELQQMGHAALAETGMTVAANMYPGVNALEPVLTRSFNALWDAGQLPAGYDAEFLMECYEDDKKARNEQ